MYVIPRLIPASGKTEANRGALIRKKRRNHMLSAESPILLLNPLKFRHNDVNSPSIVSGSRLGGFFVRQDSRKLRSTGNYWTHMFKNPSVTKSSFFVVEKVFSRQGDPIQGQELNFAGEAARSIGFESVEHLFQFSCTPFMQWRRSTRLRGHLPAGIPNPRGLPRNFQSPRGFRISFHSRGNRHGVDFVRIIHVSLK